MKFRHFVKKTLKLTFILIIVLTVLSFPYFEFFQPLRFFTWTSLVFFMALTLFSGYYNTRSINKPFFFNIFFGTLSIKFLLCLAFLFVFIVFFQPESKWFIVPFFLLFLIYKTFETIMLLRFSREADSSTP